jgi:hypothetical protein
VLQDDKDRLWATADGHCGGPISPSWAKAADGVSPHVTVEPGKTATTGVVFVVPNQVKRAALKLPAQGVSLRLRLTPA